MRSPPSTSVKVTSVGATTVGVGVGVTSGSLQGTRSSRSWSVRGGVSGGSNVTEGTITDGVTHGGVGCSGLAGEASGAGISPAGSTRLTESPAGSLLSGAASGLVLEGEDEAVLTGSTADFAGFAAGCAGFTGSVGFSGFAGCIAGCAGFTGCLEGWAGVGCGALSGGLATIWRGLTLTLGGTALSHVTLCTSTFLPWGEPGQNGVRMGLEWGWNGVRMGLEWGQNGVRMGLEWG